MPTQRTSCRLASIGLLGLLLVTSGCLCRQKATAPPAPLANTDAEVPLTILRSDSQAMAFVPVYIDGEGPFAFALDTGSSHSLIQAHLARRLGLPVDGHTVKLSGVSTVATGKLVRVDHWRVGAVNLPARKLVTLEMPKDNESVPMQGLLGSDMLSQFGRVTIDYQEGKLKLGDQQAPMDQEP